MSWLTHLVGGAVRTLLDYVSYVSICPKLRRILQTGPEWEEISDILSKAWRRASVEQAPRRRGRYQTVHLCVLPGKPRSLQHLCRLAIRGNASLKMLNDPRAMAAIPLPPTLKNYVTFGGFPQHTDLTT